MPSQNINLTNVNSVTFNWQSVTEIKLNNQTIWQEPEFNGQVPLPPRITNGRAFMSSMYSSWPEYGNNVRDIAWDSVETQEEKIQTRRLKYHTANLDGSNQVSMIETVASNGSTNAYYGYKTMYWFHGWTSIDQNQSNWQDQASDYILAPGKKYGISVKLWNSNGWSDWSAVNWVSDFSDWD